MSAIDLSQLPPPDVVEALDFETILAEMVDDLQAREPSFDAIVESDPAYKVLQVAAYRELLLRQRVNDAARAVMLAYSGKADLEHLAALHNIVRLTVDPGDPDAIPPVAPIYEADDRLRQRIQLAPEGLSTAGPAGAYEYFALSASADVLDVDVSIPAAGQVLVTVLSTVGDGVPDQALLDAVAAALSDKTVRPLTDQVLVQAAAIVNYTVDATLYVYDGPDPEVVRQAAEDAVTRFVADHHRLGHDITESGLHAALHQPGVQRVVLNAVLPPVITATEAGFCTAITVTVGGIDE